ncbi:MAG: carboxypeptidase-like regulatory domain-containing protein [Planctomycetes bacterium]|nr:carboxypeptidase-like regulatory domain-containing protein [Planctomycetota bacterium]
MKIRYIIIIPPLLVMIFIFWTMIHHKPSYKGRVIDAETKEPIAGAVAVAIYNKYPIISGPGGGSSTEFHAKEALTDENGEFTIPSYTTLLFPNSMEDTTQFIIYKRSYGNYPEDRISPPSNISWESKERYFFEKNFGKQGKVKIFSGKQRGKGLKVTFGLVELPRLKTWKERRNAGSLGGMDIPESQWILLKKMIEEEDEWLYDKRIHRR